MRNELIDRLREHGIQPSAQRLAVAAYVLNTRDHPSADQVWKAVQRKLPMLSRATIYNTLNLFVKHGLLRECVLAEGHSVFDPNLDRHHHFVDEATGEVHDIPWEQVQVSGLDALNEYDIREYQVIVRGHARQKRSLKGDHHG